MTDPWLQGRFDELCAQLGDLRGAAFETTFDWRVDRLCDELLNILNRFEPTAAEIHQEGLPVELALGIRDARELRMRRLLRERPSRLRDSGLI